MRKSDSKNILLYGHFGSQNRGCEAIVRGTLSMLGDFFGNDCIKLISNNAKADRKAMGIKCPETFEASGLRKGSLKKYVTGLFNKLKLPEQLTADIKFGGNKKHIKWADIGLSIGGDTYCYNSIERLCYFNRVFNKLKKKNILWGCSIEPGDIRNNKIIRSNLRLFDAIFARESLTYDALVESGLNKNVFLYPDPAFAMAPERVELPGGWVPGGMIGLNLSNMILNCHKDRNVMLDAVRGLIEYILNNTGYSIALIPHVIAKNSDDRKCMEELKESFAAEKRLMMIDDRYNAPETKYLISCCELFVGARTHSVIAAYSSCVPALALGYSVKAMGIAKDLFKDRNGMAVRQEDIESAKDLIEPFNNIYNEKESISKHLCDFMPGYISRLKEASLKLKEIT